MGLTALEHKSVKLWHLQPQGRKPKPTLIGGAITDTKWVDLQTWKGVNAASLIENGSWISKLQVQAVL